MELYFNGTTFQLVETVPTPTGRDEVAVVYTGNVSLVFVPWVGDNGIMWWVGAGRGPVWGCWQHV